MSFFVFGPSRRHPTFFTFSLIFILALARAQALNLSFFFFLSSFLLGFSDFGDIGDELSVIIFCTGVTMGDYTPAIFYC